MLTELKKYMAEIIGSILHETITTRSIAVNRTPLLKQGDFAFPMFSHATKSFISPVELAKKVAEKVQISKNCSFIQFGGRVLAQGPYVNVFLDRATTSSSVIDRCLSLGEKYGSSNILDNQHIMIEFSAPNTNKPLHLGHLRNDALGESLSRILVKAGAIVQKVNLVNDRGIHICKSMLAYKKFGNGNTPERTKIKSDHFVGLYYVRYAQWEKEWMNTDSSAFKKEESPEQQAQNMLRKWEAGDEEVIALWKKMNKWAIDGIFQSYNETGIIFDKVYYESETYMLGKDIILQGVKDGVFFQEENGTIFVSSKELGTDKKVLLRADGTSVYITQDIGTAKMRYTEWAFDRMIYIVAHEQNYHFQVLFHTLSKLQFKPALENRMCHLGYGMVHLPDGRMKSREGTVVDADNLLHELSSSIKTGIIKRNRESEMTDLDEVSRNVALGAIHYYLLGVNPKKDITFNPQTSIQFNGNTGPYLQYTCARINSMLEKHSFPNIDTMWNETISDEEWKIIMLIDKFDAIIEQSSEKYDPSVLANYLYELCSNFSTFYQNMPIATANTEILQLARMKISKAVLQVLKNGLYLLNIPYIEKM